MILEIIGIIIDINNPHNKLLKSKFNSNKYKRALCTKIRFSNISKTIKEHKIATIKLIIPIIIFSQNINLPISVLE